MQQILPFALACARVWGPALGTMMEPLGDYRVDWFRLLVQLKDQGYSLYGISHLTQIPKSTLIGYKNGAQPPYHQGVILVQCWAQVLNKDVADVPTISQYSYMA